MQLSLLVLTVLHHNTHTGGRALSTKISPRHVNLAGGVLFMLFAVHGVWAGPM
jgi:putative Ca2+/H+ antiporter (TMEM165/GDT1 family)